MGWHPDPITGELVMHLGKGYGDIYESQLDDADDWYDGEWDDAADEELRTWTRCGCCGRTVEPYDANEDIVVCARCSTGPGGAIAVPSPDGHNSRESGSSPTGGPA